MATPLRTFQEVEKTQALILLSKIQTLSTQLYSFTPHAKNSAFQQEIVRAHKLFKAVIYKSILLLSLQLNYNLKFYEFMGNKIAPYGNDMQNIPPQIQQILMDLAAENKQLTQRTQENEDNFTKIERFIELLKTQDKLNENERSAFWNWADQLKNLKINFGYC